MYYSNLETDVRAPVTQYPVKLLNPNAMTTLKSQTVQHSLSNEQLKAPMRCRAFSDFDQLPQEFRSLLALSVCDSYFRSESWYRAIIAETFGVADRMRLYAIADASGAPLGLMIGRCALPKGGLSRALQRRSLQSLNYGTEFKLILSNDPVDSEDVLDCLVSAWIDEHPKWTDIGLHGLDRDSALYPQLVAALTRKGFLVYEGFNFATYFDYFDGRSSNEYVATLGSSIRKRLSRRSRQLSDSVRSVQGIVSGDNFSDQAISDYEQIFRHSWKRAEPHSGFIRRIMRDGARDGSLRLSFLYVDGIPAAMQLAFVWRRKATLYRTAYDERFRSLGVGGVAIMRLIAHLIDVDRVEMIDLGIGDQPYKQEWLSKRREHWGIVAANPTTLVGVAIALRHFLIQQVKSIYNRFPWRVTAGSRK